MTYDPALDRYLEAKAAKRKIMKEEIAHALRIAFGMGIIMGVLIFLVQSCGPMAGAADARAVEIPGPVGVYCYAIMDGITVKGGNCLKAW